MLLYLLGQHMKMVEILIVIFIASYGIQCLFYFASIIALIFHQATHKRNSNEPISVIVAAHNEFENLKELIPHICNQDYENFEVIIVLDRPDANSKQLLIESEKQYEHLNHVIITTPPQGFNQKKYALQQGIESAKNDLLIFTDADCRPSSANWLKTMSDQFDIKKDVILGFSMYYRKNGILNLFIRYETIFTALTYATFTLLGLPYMGIGRNLGYKKSLFHRVQGFTGIENVTGGDDDLFINKVANKRNTALALSHESITYSFPKETWGAYLNQKTRHLSVGKYYKSRDVILLSILALSGVLFWLTFIILAAVETNLLLLASFLLLRWVLLGMDLYLFNRKLGNQFEYWAVPLLDIMFSFFNIIMGLIGFFTKRIRWK